MFTEEALNLESQQPLKYPQFTPRGISGVGERGFLVSIELKDVPPVFAICMYTRKDSSRYARRNRTSLLLLLLLRQFQLVETESKVHFWGIYRRRRDVTVNIAIKIKNYEKNYFLKVGCAIFKFLDIRSRHQRKV